MQPLLRVRQRGLGQLPQKRKRAENTFFTWCFSPISHFHNHTHYTHTLHTLHTHTTHPYSYTGHLVRAHTPHTHTHTHTSTDHTHTHTHTSTDHTHTYTHTHTHTHVLTALWSTY